MFLPFRDDNPHTTTPFVNYAVIAMCAAVFLWQFSLGDKAGQVAVYQYGVIPGNLFGTVEIDPRLVVIAPWMTIFTSMFMHGGIMHFLGNMLYLWIFGDNIEASLGHVRYAIFYLLCGVAAALAQSFAVPTSMIPMIGASGAISGVLGAYLVLHPRANIRVFVWLFIYVAVWNLPAFLVLGGWFVMQLLSSASVAAGQPGVAFMAHVGGFIAGAVFIFFFKKRGVQVFEPAHTRAFALEKRPTGRSRIPDSGGSRRGPWD
jgi:membrane associated rhomboid family serine protease